MASAAPTTTFAEQRAFAAEVAKEKAAIEWAMEQSMERQKTRRRVRRRRRDGTDVFNVTFFDGDKPKRMDWLAGDAKREAEFQIGDLPERGSLEFRLRQLKGGALSKSRSEPCLGSAKRRERKRQQGVGYASTKELKPFRTLFPLPAKGIDLRKEAARTQADLFHPRPETVALSAAEKHDMRRWDVDVDAVTWPDGTTPPRWVKAVGNTTNKWANREMTIAAAREQQEFIESLQGSSPSRTKKPPVARREHCRRHRHQPSRFAAPSWPPSSPAEAKPPPPWAKELSPVRDGLRQLASGEIISFLDQHVYPQGGVAEAKRARRREKEAFLRTVFLRRFEGDGPATARRRGAAPSAGATEKTGCYPAKRGGSVHRGSGAVKVLHSVATSGRGGDGDGIAPSPAADAAWALSVPEGDNMFCGLAPFEGYGSRENCSQEAGLRHGAEKDSVCAIVDHAGGGAGWAAERPGCVEQEQQQQQQRQAAGGVAGIGDSGDREERRLSESDCSHPCPAGDGDIVGSTEGGQPEAMLVSDEQGSGGQAGLSAAAARSSGRSIRKKSQRLSVSKGTEGRVPTPSPLVTSSMSVLDMGVLKPPER